MKYTNIEEIRSHFKLNASTVEGLIEELNSIQLDLHPDKTGGSFKSEEAKNNYYDISEAIEFLRKLPHSSSYLVPISLALDIFREANFLQKESPTEQLSRSIKDGLDRSNKTFLIPKYFTTGLTAIMGALWAFPNAVADNPILSEWLTGQGYQTFTTLWLYALVMTAALWFFAGVISQRNTLLGERMKSETFQNYLFHAYIEMQSSRSSEFSKTDFIDFLAEELKFRVKFGLFRASFIDSQLIEDFANTVLERMQKKKVITQSEKVSLEDLFIINSHLVSLAS